jgi:hypothetical protein
MLSVDLDCGRPIAALRDKSCGSTRASQLAQVVCRRTDIGSRPWRAGGPSLPALASALCVAHREQHMGAISRREEDESKVHLCPKVIRSTPQLQAHLPVGLARQPAIDFVQDELRLRNRDDPLHRKFRESAFVDKFVASGVASIHLYCTASISRRVSNGASAAGYDAC